MAIFLRGHIIPVELRSYHVATKNELAAGIIEIIGIIRIIVLCNKYNIVYCTINTIVLVT